MFSHNTVLSRLRALLIRWPPTNTIDYLSLSIVKEGTKGRLSPQQEPLLFQSCSTLTSILLTSIYLICVVTGYLVFHNFITFRLHRSSLQYFSAVGLIVDQK
jgi:hypothetical protein